MTHITIGFTPGSNPATTGLAALRSCLDALRRARPQKPRPRRAPRGTDAEIRREVGRLVPDHLRRDLGLDPDVL